MPNPADIAWDDVNNVFGLNALSTQNWSYTSESSVKVRNSEPFFGRIVNVVGSFSMLKMEVVLLPDAHAGS